MKWSIIALMGLGIVAAGAAFVVVAGMRSARGAPQASEINVLVASRAIPAHTIVKADSVKVVKTPPRQAPSDCLQNPVQVVGRVLALPMADGQAFSDSAFATDQSGLQLASVLAQGKRAVTLNLDESSALTGIVYPGCLVDVLACFKKGSSAKDAISMTLLEGVQVLAVERTTLFAKPGSEDGPAPGVRANRRMVTLLLDVQQAQILQLALSYGTVSLALRNPLDSAPVNSPAVYLSSISDEGHSIGAPAAPHPIEHVQSVLASVLMPDDTPAKGRWQVVVIRGTAVETQDFPTID